MKDISRQLEKLYSYTCNIFNLTHIKDDTNKRTFLKKTLIYESIPCRISYFNSSSVNYFYETDTNNKRKQFVKLILQNDIDILPGSYVTVFKNSKKIGDFKNSGVPLIYSSHQEISLSISEEFY